MMDADAPQRSCLEWSSHGAVERNQFGDETLRLRIAEDGTVGRFLPYCEAHLTLLDDAFQPLKAEPLQSEAEARALLERVRGLK